MTAKDKIPLIFEVHNVMYIIFDYLSDTADLKNVSLAFRALNEAVKHHLFRFMTLPGAAMGLRDPKRYNILKGLDPANDFRRVSALLSDAQSLTVSRRFIASAAPFTAPRSLREDWGLDDIELMGQCHEIYVATGKILSEAKNLRHLEFHGFHVWLNVLKLLHMRESKKGFQGIQSIKITPPEKYKHLLRVPEDVQVDEHLKADMSMVLGVKGRVIPDFKFRCLTILTLHGLHFEPSSGNLGLPPCILPLIVLLKNAEQLRCLELSTINEGDCDGSNLVVPSLDEADEQPPPVLGGASAQPQGQMMRLLCLKYKRAGGSPLQHLRYLRLGPGCVLESPRHTYPAPEDFPHRYLAYLFNLSGLVELHLDYPLVRTDAALQPASDAVERLINPRWLPKLRKLSLPYNIWHWWGTRSDTHRRPEYRYTAGQTLTVRFVRYRYHERPPTSLCIFDLRSFSGLVLPTESMDLQEIPRIDTLRFMKNLRSVKLPLPSMCEAAVCRFTPHYGEFLVIPRGHICHLAHVESLLEGTTDLRDLWLAGDFQASGTDPMDDPMDEAGYHYKKIISHTYMDHNVQIEKAVRKFFLRFHKLEYIRILHRAWRRERKNRHNSEEAQVDDKGFLRWKVVGPEVRELTPWQVENDIPEAFDYRTPSLFRGRQYS
ncbi:hypothetical protein QBC32DRAFT_316956 [Pseudoneurospora amorphoporcata]|uniref:Uncharacterized protein n=1 Tax=Pseudoneurospora amorphoporcata TaxID=241081 RepID=A0AAN6SDL8_9PEZI|nr:hypothetical protein QBC32DRAFT_316956 [Pseudoneurospora amorphoporcata]